MHLWLNWSTQNAPLYLCIHRVTFFSSEIIKILTCAISTTSHTSPSHNKTTTCLIDAIICFGPHAVPFFFTFQFDKSLFLSAQKKLFSSMRPVHFTMLFYVQPGHSVFESYQWFASCGESSQVVVMKSFLDKERNRYTYILTAFWMAFLCHHKGIFFTMQRIFVIHKMCAPWTIIF